MTSVAEVKRLLGPLLSKNRDLGLQGRLAVMRPMQNFMVGIYIGRTGSADCFSPVWAVNALFNPRHSFSLSEGAEIYPKPGGLWKFSTQNVEEQLAAQVEEDVLPMLRDLGDFERICEFLLIYPFHGGPVATYIPTRIFLDIARGDWKMADQNCSDIVTDWQQRRGTQDVSDLAPIALTLAPLVAARDRAGIARVLHGWEAITVKKYKLEKYWEPTLFPVERVE